jgi:hypothetical protein
MSDLHPDDTFDGVWDHTAPTERLDHGRRAARTLRERMLDTSPVPYYRSFDLVRVPYPTRYGLRDAFAGRSEFMHLLNRMFIVQFRGADGLKTLLVSPSDVDANRETPFFKRLAHRYRRLGQRFMNVLGPVLGDVPSALATAGIRPEQVDYITYDHLHTQDLRNWLGEGGLFPNAKLLVMAQEWASTQALLPQQRDWYCPDGWRIPEERVVKLAGTTLLGDGAVALVHTPGHTEGNHSIVAHTPDGLLVTSENGIGADAYAPLASAIPGVRKYAQATGMEVILNGNTLEGALDQYVSMVIEKTIAGPAKDNPEFTNVMSSSELASYWLFPGLKPTFSFGTRCYGAPE